MQWWTATPARPSAASRSAGEDRGANRVPSAVLAGSLTVPERASESARSGMPELVVPPREWSSVEHPWQGSPARCVTAPSVCRMPCSPVVYRFGTPSGALSGRITCRYSRCCAAWRCRWDGARAHRRGGSESDRASRLHCGTSSFGDQLDARCPRPGTRLCRRPGARQRGLRTLRGLRQARARPLPLPRARGGIPGVCPTMGVGASRSGRELPDPFGEVDPRAESIPLDRHNLVGGESRPQSPCSPRGRHRGPSSNG